MSVRALLALGPAFFRSLRQLPSLLYKAPKTYQVLTAPIRSAVAPQSRTFGFFGRFANTETLVSVIRRSISAAGVNRRPNSLLRVYNGLAGGVHLRHNTIILPAHSYTTINKLSDPPKKSWFANFIASFNRVPRLPSFLDRASPLSPRGILGFGCNSAVWAADLEGLNGKNHELAVKVLYNYYTPSSSSVASYGSENAQDGAVDWLLLHRQLERECTLRPKSGHPNIVPIIGHFLDHTPASAVSSGTLHDDSIVTLTDSSTLSEAPTESVHRQAPTTRKWVGAEAFPEGFGGNPLTYYLLMPRFDATLREFLRGDWPGENLTMNSSTASETSSSSFIVLSQSSLDSPSTSRTICSPSVDVARQSRHIELEDAIAISAQLFDAVAELERHGVAHRDIKPDNVLIRHRIPAANLPSARSTTSTTGLEWLDDKEVSTANSRYHVALTDFGCAVRTGNSSMPSRLSEVFGRLLDRDDKDDELMAHSGNLALLAPELAGRLHQGCYRPRGPDYSKSDLWAMATLVYPLFGVQNPFLDSTLSSATYTETELPGLPDATPGVVTWLLEECLKRTPHERPSADLVADVLHTWTLLRHAHRRQMFMRTGQTTPRENCDLTGEHDELFSVDLLEQLSNFDKADSMSSALITRLRTLLDVSWAADWLTGPARPPDGLRVSFYRRVTLDRFAHCLRIVYQAETARAARLANCLSTALRATSSG